MKRLFAMVTLCVCAGAWLASAEEAAPKTDAAAATASVKPAMCPCDGHVLAIKGDTALCCACEKACKCTLSDDGKQCSCGKPVQTYDLAGKFVCAACKCTSPKEAKCPKCDKAMTKVDKTEKVEKPAAPKNE